LYYIVKDCTKRIFNMDALFCPEISESFMIWRENFGPIVVNLGVIVVGLIVLMIAIYKNRSNRKTRLFETSYHLFLVGILYFTLHNRLLQIIFPIQIPERPLIDNFLTYNYTLTSILTFIVFPQLLNILLRNDTTLEKLGLKIIDIKQTVKYTFQGLVINTALFLISNTLFGFKWIREYTSDGLVLWLLLVSILSVFTQTLFFNGFLFNVFLDEENGILLGLISIYAFQMFIASTLPWTVSNILSSILKIIVTWKTRNVYGATIMSITTNLLEIFIQI